MSEDPVELVRPRRLAGRNVGLEAPECRDPLSFRQPLVLAYSSRCALTRAVMSWAMTESPTVLPSSSFDVEAVISTSTRLPSLRRARGFDVLRRAACPQPVAHFDCSLCLSSGAMISIGCPMISSAV